MKPSKEPGASSAEIQKDVSEGWKSSSPLKEATRDHGLDLSPAPLSESPSSPAPLSESPSSIEVMRCQYLFFYYISNYMKT